MINKLEYKKLKELIDHQCNKSIVKPEWKEPIIFVHRNLKKALKSYYKYFSQTHAKEKRK